MNTTTRPRHAAAPCLRGCPGHHDIERDGGQYCIPASALDIPTLRETGGEGVVQPQLERDLDSDDHGGFGAPHYQIRLIDPEQFSIVVTRESARLLASQLVELADAADLDEAILRAEVGTK